jgi:putative flippase GtrA
MRLLASSSIPEFIKYVIASAFALMVDLFVYWLLVVFYFVAVPEAATVGYCIGLIVAYFLISGRVFRGGWLQENKKYEFSMFILSGLFGVSITYLCVFLSNEVVGLDYFISKALAVGVSFCSVFVFRKIVVFRRGNR